MGGSPRPIGPVLHEPALVLIPLWQQLLALLIMFLTGTWWGFWVYKFADGRPDKNRIITGFWLSTIGILIYALLILNLTRLLSPIAKIVSFFGLHLTQGITVVLVFFLGWAAYRFKRSNKLFYGIVEIFFGLISAFAIVSRVTSVAAFSDLSLAQFGGLIGSAYIVARGFINFHEAKHLSGEKQK